MTKGLKNIYENKDNNPELALPLETSVFYMEFETNPENSQLEKTSRFSLWANFLNSLFFVVVVVVEL